jgi:hypothetical protein
VILLVGWSVSFPQTLKLGVQAEIEPVAIALPVLNGFPGCAVTSTTTVCFEFVHPTTVDP